MNGENDAITGAKSVLDDLNGYEIFVLKKHPYFDTTYYYYLQSQHGIILQDYSKSFCKMELVDELKLKERESKPDEICY
jgi:hypothetical protein